MNDRSPVAQTVHSLNLLFHEKAETYPYFFGCRHCCGRRPRSPGKQATRQKLYKPKTRCHKPQFTLARHIRIRDIHSSSVRKHIRPGHTARHPDICPALKPSCKKTSSGLQFFCTHAK